MAENIRRNKDFDTKPGLGQKIDEMITMVRRRRHKFEQRWYDNNFFDDGFHFRYVSRTTGKILDLSTKDAFNFPLRAIPKASRQIRAIANLLVQPEYVPVVFPDNTRSANFSSPEEFEKAKELAKLVAEKTGDWIEDLWDEQELKEKLTEMVMIAMKNSVAFMQIWPDAVDEKIKTTVYDPFDIYHLGDHDSIENSPFVIKVFPETLDKIKANELFDKAQVLKVINDNKYSRSEVKNAYMLSRYGAKGGEDTANSALLAEAFIKEYLTDENFATIASKFPDATKGKKKGDMVMRHTFTASGIWLRDEYLNINSYPFVSFTMEPGPLWQTPQIERFIPANKSLDIIMSRLERFMNTMVTGTWLKRKGENMQFTNIPGGQVLSYTTTPPVQAKMANVPSGMMALIEKLEQHIEEQGASVAGLGVLPPGVKSGVAIEEVKASEFANLKIAADQMKKTVKGITEKFLEIADEHFVTERTIGVIKGEQPSFFRLIGARGAELKKELKEELSADTIVIKKETPVKIEIFTGLAFTPEGKRNVMQQISAFMLQLVEQKMINPAAVQLIVQRFLETFNFGPTAEFMDAIDLTETEQITEDEIDKIKIAVAQVIKDLGLAGPQAEQSTVDATKLGVAETIKDLGGGQ